MSEYQRNRHHCPKPNRTTHPLTRPARKCRLYAYAVHTLPSREGLTCAISLLETLCFDPFHDWVKFV